MASTSTDIANDALHFIGEASVSNIDTDTSKRAQMCKRWLPIVRAELFRKQPWNFLLKRAQLAANSVAPLFGFSYSYQLPADCLRVYKVNDMEDNWKVEGRAIMTDASTCNLLYVADTTDYSILPADIRMGLVYKLGQAVAPVLTGKPQITNLCAQMAREVLGESITADSTENYPDQPLDADDWVDARL
jgi:hypothetical protein